MLDDQFEWDDEKAAQNLRAHGVEFETAREVFQDRFVITMTDPREDYGEERYRALGMVRDRLLYVAYTMRDERIRVISVRYAEPWERRMYHEEES
jgi:uncharacterized DUF497 family protein